MSAYITNQCPQCGANLPADQTNLNCPNCRTFLGVEAPGVSIPGEYATTAIPESPHNSLVRNFKKFMTRGSNSDETEILTVSNGDFYVQLLYGESPRNVTCAAVSNEFLPKGRQISSQREALLVQMGFRYDYEVDGFASDNFGRSVDLSQSDKIEEFAEQVELIFSQVYGCSSLVELTFEPSEHGDLAEEEQYDAAMSDALLESAAQSGVRMRKDPFTGEMVEQSGGRMRTTIAGKNLRPRLGRTMRFQHPVNGYVEEVSSPGLWVLLFGVFYFAAKGVWTHALVGALLAVLTAGISWLIYPLYASGIMRKHYLGRGWVEI